VHNPCAGVLPQVRVEAMMTSQVVPHMQHAAHGWKAAQVVTGCTICRSFLGSWLLSHPRWALHGMVQLTLPQGESCMLYSTR
jgi:hypothetical protein